MEITRNQIKLVKSLQRKKERFEQGLFIVEGRKSVLEALNSGMMPVMLFHVKEINDFSAFELAQTVSFSEMERITALSSPSEALAVFSIPEKTELPEKFDDKLIIFLDGIQDPGNLGTIIRIADWFGLSGVFCSTDCVDTYNPKTIQASMGSLFHINIHRTDAEKLFVSAGDNYRIICADLNGTNLWEIQNVKSHPAILVIGSEAHGPKPETRKLANEIVTIPGNGKAESLNAAVSCGIIVSSLLR